MKITRIAFAAALALASPALTAPTGFAFGFTASGFAPSDGFISPDSSLSGSATFTINDLAADQLASIPTAFSLTIAGQTFDPGNVMFDYHAGAGILRLYGTPMGVGTQAGTEDFDLSLYGFQNGVVGVPAFVYSRTGYGTTFVATDVQLEGVTVPEPGSIALIGLGVVGLAFTNRRRKRLA